MSARTGPGLNAEDTEADVGETQPLGTRVHGRAHDREARDPRILHSVGAQAGPQRPLSYPCSVPGPCATAAALSPAAVRSQAARTGLSAAQAAGTSGDPIS